jgi:hypothetical protein
MYPLQVTFTREFVMLNGALGCVTFKFPDKLHPLMSVIVKEYVPADKFEIVEVFCPLTQLYVYGIVPPAALIAIDPVEFPKHNTLVTAEVDDKGNAGSDIT